MCVYINACDWHESGSLWFWFFDQIHLIRSLTVLCYSTTNLTIGISSTRYTRFQLVTSHIIFKWCMHLHQAESPQYHGDTQRRHKNSNSQVSRVLYCMWTERVEFQAIWTRNVFDGCFGCLVLSCTAERHKAALLTNSSYKRLQLPSRWPCNDRKCSA